MKKFKVTFNSPVTLGLIFISLAVLIINYLSLGYSNMLLFMTYRSSLMSPLTYVRFFTHVLGHADWGHFISNATYILLLGPMLEEKYGSKMLVWVIMITALVTGIVHFVLFPNAALCGASGVVFAFILMTSFTGFKEGEVPLTFILVAIVFIGQQVYDGIFIQDDISNLTHILGGIVGSVIGYKLNKKQG